MMMKAQHVFSFLYGYGGVVLGLGLAGCVQKPGALEAGHCRCMNDCPPPQQCLVEELPLTQECVAVEAKGGRCGMPSAETTTGGTR